MKKVEELNRIHNKLRHDLICEINKRLKELFPESGLYEVEENQFTITTGIGNEDISAIEIDWEMPEPVEIVIWDDNKYVLSDIETGDLLAVLSLLFREGFFQ